jgi:hypothetical protein
MRLNYYDFAHYHGVMSQDDKQRRIVCNRLDGVYLNVLMCKAASTVVLISPLFFNASCDKRWGVAPGEGSISPLARWSVEFTVPRLTVQPTNL